MKKGEKIEQNLLNVSRLVYTNLLIFYFSIISVFTAFKLIYKSYLIIG